MIAVLGVDPGVRGGMALLRADGTVSALWASQPDMAEIELVAAVCEAAAQLKLHGSRTCFMEKVGYIRGDGGQGAFTFGKVTGLIRGALLASGIESHDVYPMMWQAKMECLTGGNKNVSKRRAIELYPKEKITHAVADALLIARYGWERSKMPGSLP